MEQALKNQIRRLSSKLEHLEKLSSRISNFRLFDFILAVVVIYFAARTGSTLLFVVILVLAIIFFIVLIKYHRKVDRWVEHFNVWIKIRKNHIARKNLDWEHIPETGQQGQYEKHPFGQDLDVVGDRSLLRLIDAAIYPGGTAQLENWLLNTEPDVDKLKERQQLIRELKPTAHFRDRLSLNATIARKGRGENDWEMEDLLLWIRSTQRSDLNKPLMILGSLAATNIILLVLYLIGLIAPWVIFTFIAYLIIYNLFSSKSSGLFDEAQQIDELLSQFYPVLHFLENFSYKANSRLKKFCAPFHKGEHLPSKRLKKIIRITSAASSSSNEILWFVFNALVPWDIYFSKKLNEFKGELESSLPIWIDTFYRLEALNSIANFAWLNDDYIFALPDEDQSPAFSAQELGHPLIPKTKKVKNDVTIENNGDIMLITGSNMAGKSTFLRTIGINLALCFAGAPVNATRFSAIPLRLFSSINVTDSLDEGLSHFYAEVKRLRALMDELEANHSLPLLYFVDEIYRGTNNRERLTGSSAFLKQVVGKNGIGLVTTHDLELAGLEESIPSLSNWHFEETIEDGKMYFEYKLKDGPCKSTNALKIMRNEGLPV